MAESYWARKLVSFGQQVVVICEVVRARAEICWMGTETASVV